MSDPYSPCGPDCAMAPPTGLDDASGDEHQDCPEPAPQKEQTG
jgi:hypothetical protein